VIGHGSPLLNLVIGHGSPLLKLVIGHGSLLLFLSSRPQHVEELASAKAIMAILSFLTLTHWNLAAQKMNQVHPEGAGGGLRGQDEPRGMSLSDFEQVIFATSLQRILPVLVIDFTVNMTGLFIP
jgi:hypothetical protein